MARTGFFHHVGTFLLFAATVLLIITCISAPVIKDIAILKVDLGDKQSSDHSTVTFGTFGYCVNEPGGGRDGCSRKKLGYSPADVMASADGTNYSDHAKSTTKALTKALVLHPIACGMNFIAFLLALGAGVVGSLLASLVALSAFIVTVVVMIIDFVLFSIIKSKVNSSDASANAHFSTAAWTTLASAICALLGTIVVFFTCCSSRLHSRHHSAKSSTGAYDAPPRRRRWF
ncbi:pali-domain-containing protein [Phialemonium atrogriseum]|uniref:Pali-domain-containing protein n=1 Tax=Phialemonium atrogriseum TaxID=1093897 RepID=A0AAJ0FQ93_9PEZI|nr:pali-domain-containing protein [Phialemonium atrogriseum]KAK1771058.1 pali-domain-containing protein [Phialemonium atrogriseum]